MMIFRNSRSWICSFPGSFSWYSVKKDFDFWIVASRWGSKERSGPFFQGRSADRFATLRCRFISIISPMVHWNLLVAPNLMRVHILFEIGPTMVMKKTLSLETTRKVIAQWMPGRRVWIDKNQCSLWPQNLNLKDLFHHTSTLQMGRV